jgi:outer membrane lipoprotein carrier protein
VAGEVAGGGTTGVEELASAGQNEPGATESRAEPAPDDPAAAPPVQTVPPASREPTGGAPASPGPPGVAGEPADSAVAILERASARYQGLSALQADFTMTYENPLLRSRSTGEGVLYQKRPDRLLLRFSEPAGDVILSDGRYFWVYYPSIDAAQVLRSEASAGSTSGVDLQAQFLGDPARRFAATLDGEETVAGRRAWQLTLKPRERLGYQQLRVWLDQRDYLARRFEITEDNGSTRRFELRNLRLDPTFADNLFRFDVPAGARVVTR